MDRLAEAVELRAALTGCPVKAGLIVPLRVNLCMEKPIKAALVFKINA
jgi:hypothetical protein